VNRPETRDARAARLFVQENFLLDQATVQQDRPCAEGGERQELVGRDEDGPSRPREGRDLGAQEADARVIECRERLIENQYVGPVRQCDDQGDFLAHPRAVGDDLTAGSMGEPEPVEELVDALSTLRSYVASPAWRRPSRAR